MNGGSHSSETALPTLTPPTAPPRTVSPPADDPPPRLSAGQRRLLFALMVPGGPQPLPDDAFDVDPAPVIAAAARAGLIVGVARNARVAGLQRLAIDATPASHRQRFEARAHLRVAVDAAQRLRDATGSPPLALGALAAAHRLYAAPEERLARPLRFLVPESAAARARRAVRDLPGVRVATAILDSDACPQATDAVWLRAAPADPTDGRPWRQPSLEDLALTSALLLDGAAPMERLGLLTDLALAARDPGLHLPSLAQRATLWGVRDHVWRALIELRERLNVPLTDDLLQRVRPSAWARLVRLLFA